MDKDIQDHVKRCQVCQQSAYPKQEQLPLQPLPQTTGPNQRVHIDLFGPLKTMTTEGKEIKKWVVVMTDSFTKITRLQAITEKSAEAVGDAILQQWISIFGAPRVLVTDQGLEFCNEVVKHLWKELGVRHLTTTPYHPQTNAQVEIFNKVMAMYFRSIMKMEGAEMGGWEPYLLPLMISYNTAVHKSTLQAPFYTMFGFDHRIPLWDTEDILEEDEGAGETVAQNMLRLRRTQQKVRRQAQANNTLAREAYTDQHNKTATDFPDYQKGQQVWIRRLETAQKNPKLNPKWEEGEIVERMSESTYKVLRPGRKRRAYATINVKHIKPRFVDETMEDTDKETEDEDEVSDEKEVDSEEELFQSDTEPAATETEDFGETLNPYQRRKADQGGPHRMVTRRKAKLLAAITKVVAAADWEEEDWSMDWLQRLFEEMQRSGESYMIRGLATNIPRPAASSSRDGGRSQETPPRPARQQTARDARDPRTPRQAHQEPTEEVREGSHVRQLKDKTEEDEPRSYLGTPNSGRKSKGFFTRKGSLMLKALTPGSADKKAAKVRPEKKEKADKKESKEKEKKELAQARKEKARARKEASKGRHPSGQPRRPSGSLESRRLQDYNLPGAQEVQGLPPLGRTRRASREERGGQIPFPGFSSKYLPSLATGGCPSQAAGPRRPSGPRQGQC